MQLFCGAGGGLLADFILNHIPVLAVEYDPDRCSLLRHRYPGLAIAEGDCKQMDFHQWNGKVDLLCAGIPCPKWSTARCDMGDPEDLSDEVIRISNQVQSKWVFLECVPGFKSEHARMARRFSEIGYTLSRPLLLDASSVGAPILRKRYWAVARANESCKPMRPIDAKASVLPSPDATLWEINPTDSAMVNGVADRWEMECAGDGQVPLQAATAMKLLGIQ